MRLVFDGFEVVPDACQLFRDGIEVPLERRALDLLCYFAAHPGRSIRREELLENVWHARTLSEGVLANTVAKLRKAIDQPAAGREPLETVGGRGYRWHAIARQLPDQERDGARKLGVRDPCDPFVRTASA